MSSQDFVRLALQLTAMLACALVLGELLRGLKQPAVVGEMFGGILLGTRARSRQAAPFARGGDSPVDG